MIGGNSNTITSPVNFDGVNNCQTSSAVLRLWEIAPFFKCPAIGLCFTPVEQKHLLKKAGMPWKDKNHFQVHQMLVASAENENNLSRKVDHLLTRKFGRQAEPMRQLPEQTFIQHWRFCFKSGQYLAVFWAAASRADLSTEAKSEIYGAIHMSMFTNAEQDIQVKRLLEKSQKEIEEKFQNILILKQKCKGLQNKNELLSRTQIMLEAKLLSISKEKNALNESHEALKGQNRSLALETENQHLKAALSDKTEQFQSMERELKFLEKRSAALAKDLESQMQADLQLKTEVQEAFRVFIDANRCDPHCPAFDLCRKRVLIVGGIKRMESLYRQLIEGRGGTFDYHDGHMNGGTKQLENCLKRADIVLCPVNCNSHAACSLVKHLGKKYNRPVYFMANFSLNAISQVVRESDTKNTARN